MNQYEDDLIEAAEYSLSLKIKDDDLEFLPTSLEREQKFQEVLKHLMPYLGSNETKIILAEILIALKLEGFIGKSLSDKEIKLVKVINEAVQSEPKRKKQALKYAYKLLGE